jgi:hypothetical protein
MNRINKTPHLGILSILSILSKPAFFRLVNYSNGVAFRHKMSRIAI